MGKNPDSQEILVNLGSLNKKIRGNIYLQPIKQSGFKIGPIREDGVRDHPKAFGEPPENHIRLYEYVRHYGGTQRGQSGGLFSDPDEHY